MYYAVAVIVLLALALALPPLPPKPTWTPGRTPVIITPITGTPVEAHPGGPPVRFAYLPYITVPSADQLRGRQ